MMAKFRYECEPIGLCDTCGYQSCENGCQHHDFPKTINKKFGQDKICPGWAEMTKQQRQQRKCNHIER